jgi:ADP-heptose:LPS heptosyltransferase
MKVLIIRFSSIGDVVLTTPVLRALKEQLPECELHYVTREPFEALIQHNPHLSFVHTFKRSIHEILPALRAQKFDRIIDLHNNLRSHLLTFRLSGKVTRFKKLNLNKWLLVNFKWNMMPDLHVVDRYFGAVASLGVLNDQRPGEIFLNEEDRIDTESFLSLSPGTYYTVALGAQFATKRIPEKLLVEIIRRTESPVVLLGGQEDQQTGQRLMERLKDRTIINTCGQCTILGSASIIEQSAGILTGDTGLMHIAACFGVPIISVWGNTVPELGMFPYLPGGQNLFSIHEVKNLSCRPCSKIGFQQCPKKHFNCMNLQDPESISSDMNSRFFAEK